MSDLSGRGTDLPVDRAALLGEAYKRGILPPQQRGLYEEGVRRGLFKEAGAQAPPASSVPTPATAGNNADPFGTFAPPADVPAQISPSPREELAKQLRERFGGSGTTRSMVFPGQIRAMQEDFTARAKLAEEERRLKAGYEPGVDYETGTSFADAIQMKRMDNPAERRAMLEGRYGKDKVFQDKRGEFYVETPEGKRIAPEGSGFIKNTLAGVYAGSPEIIGAGIGSALASAGGPLGAVGGAVVGGATGKAANEAIKLLSGQQRKTLGEEVASLAKAGVEQGVGEGAGRILTAIPGVAGQAYRKFFTGTTPEMRSLAASVDRAGGAAPLRSVTPGLSSAIQRQDISTKLGSDYLEERNRAAVHTRLREIIESTGKSPQQAQAELSEILDPTARVSSRRAGESIVGAVRQEASQLEGDVTNIARDADQVLAMQLGRLNALSRRAPAGALGEDLAEGIGQARADFSTAMGKGYARVDQMTGNAPVVPQGLVQRRAQEVLDALPKDARGEPIFGDANVLRSIRQLATTADNLPLGQAKAIRSTLGELGELTDMTPGVAKHQFEQLRRAQDVAIGQAAADPAVAPAINLLRSLDSTYAEGIRKFKDAALNRMVNQAKTGIAPDPGRVAADVLKPEQSARAAEIKKMVGPDVWRRVGAADWQNVMATATDVQTGEVSARRLAAAIKARDRGVGDANLLNLTYGPHIANDMRLYSQRMDARGGKVPASTLAPDNFGATMRALETAQFKQDAFLKTNYLAELSKPGPLEDSAVSFIVRPREETRLIEAQSFFGDASPQMQAIRDQARKELLNSAIVPTTTGAGTTIEGTGIEEALGLFTSKQQEILFPGGLADDMKQLAKEIRFMFPARPDQMAGGLIAGEVKNLPLSLRIPGGRIPMRAYYQGMAWIYSQPGVVHALANGLRPGPGKDATRETIRTIFRSAAEGMLGDTPGAEAAGAERDDVSAQPQLSPREDLANKIRERMRAQ